MNACQNLSGFNLMGRYLVCLYYQQNKITKKKELEMREKELAEYKKSRGVS